MYMCNWTDIHEMCSDFKIEEHVLDGCEVLLAHYSYESCEGEAFVLFRKDGDLYEVNGSHCSCYGLEGQWRPEPTTAEAIRHMIEKGTLGKSYYKTNVFADELLAILDNLEG